MKDIYAEPGSTPDVERARDAESTPNTESAPDVESDPALDDQVGSDWSDEGGAVPSGPQITLDPPD